MTENNPHTVLTDLFSSQRFAVLATEQAGAPYANLVAFAVTRDLKKILFATPRMTRKYGNLQRNPQVALLIDSRANRAADLQAATAVTAVGRAAELVDAERQAFFSVYLARHPSLLDFAHAPTTSLFCISVERYVVVDHFQHVVVLNVDQKL